MNTKEPEMLNIDRLEEIVLDLPREQINPLDDEGNCVYTSEHGEHCLVGEILVRCGFDVPAPHSEENKMNVSGLFDQEGFGYSHYISFNAMKAMQYMQTIADDETKRFNPEAWGKAIDSFLYDIQNEVNYDY